ncbi:hypothetical protein [Vagococcus lutrae]|uniref:hypothetical protein n=1 Tax=Vagococcus lutrae TaxID=81947 RepID=UPI001FECB017|nr:hypothetical protein [Vagococcus lutrae]
MSVMQKTMRIIRKFTFYLSSFLPLYLLLFIQNVKIRDKNHKRLNVHAFFSQFFITSSGSVKVFWIALTILIVLSILGIVIFVKVYRKSPGRRVTLKAVDYVHEDTMGYIVTYIVPMISMDINSYRSLLVNFLLFLIIGSFYVKNDQIFMNPLYNFLGYNVFSAEDRVYITRIKKHEIRVISKNNTFVRINNILGDIYLLTKD